MKKIFLLGFGALAGCSALTASDNLTTCEQALIAAGTINPITLFKVASSNPACIAVGEAAIQSLIAKVVPMQRARGVTQ